MLARMHANKCEYLIAGCLAASLFLGTIIFLPADLSAATQDAQKPAELTTDGKIKKIPDVVEDHIPAIELPEKLEILPPKDDSTTDTGPIVKPEVNATELPAIQRDFSKLPKPVAQMRKLIMEAARSGKIEDLRQLIGSGEDITMLSLGGIDGDPIEFVKSLSGDNQGHEILAILLEVLEAGYVHLDAGTDHELYVWPYFFRVAFGQANRCSKGRTFPHRHRRRFSGYAVIWCVYFLPGWNYTAGPLAVLCCG